MMKNLSLSTSAVITLAAALVLMPPDAAAQAAGARELAPRVCTAGILPARIAAGTNASKVTVTLSEDIGEVTGLEASMEVSQITVTAAADMPPARTGSERPEAIMGATNDSTWTIWLNTSKAPEGMQTVTFVAGDKSCAGELEITPAN